MDAQQAFDRFERSGAGWLPLVLMILAATLLTGATLAGVGRVPTEETQLKNVGQVSNLPMGPDGRLQTRPTSGELTEERISDE